eukprot:9490906-Pyramimonas_sp.AAC.1
MIRRRGAMKLRVASGIAGTATEAFGGAPYGTTKRVGVRRTGTRAAVRTLPLEPSAELPVEPRSA